MSVQEFITALREAFGEKFELPLLFRYTDHPIRPVEKTGGCFFKVLAQARAGQAVGLNAENIGCGGGKFYTGFSPMPEFVPQFVSLKERYKQTPEMVLEFIATLDLKPALQPWLEFIRIDRVENFDNAEGLLFFATPDELAGLVTWATFDNNAADAVATPFGSGCSTVVAQTVRENRIGGQRCFLGLFDPSVRPWVGANELGFVIPMSRFVTMSRTMRQSCLFDTHAWTKVRERINGKK